MGRKHKLPLLPAHSLAGEALVEAHTHTEWKRDFFHVFLFFFVLRSYSILNCASPSSFGSVGGLFDGKLNDSLLDSLMEASSPAGLCPPMQVQHRCRRILVLL